MKSIIIGTAGHIDHGKTTLVRALTGTDTDRLPEEKRRGITIDLGFAELETKTARFGFVDVPGHERFVKNMLAGAHGIDAVMLVVAADEGVMPQTREHFEICRLLGVKAGCVCLTKRDAVDDELLELVRVEVAELVEGSFLESAPVVAVSGKTGAGVEELKQVLLELARRMPPRGDAHVARLPVDRAFGVRGFGSVVTGTLVAGEIAEGDEMELLPVSKPVRVRGVQVHNSATKKAVAGQRTAVNLGGVETIEIHRGMTLAPLARLRPSQAIDARVEVLKNAPRPLRSRMRVRVAIGAAEVLARVSVIEETGEIPAGASGFAQLRFESPVVAVMNERFIIRSYSPQHTVAGGVVIDPQAVRHRRREFAQIKDKLARLLAGDTPVRVAVFAESAGDKGTSASDIAALTGWTDAVIKSAIEKAVSDKQIVDASGVLMSPSSFEALQARMIRQLKNFHKREPLARGLARETLREQIFARISNDVFRFALNEAAARGLIVAERDVVRDATHKVDLSVEERAVQARLETLYRSAALEPLKTEDALAKVAASVDVSHARKLLRMLIESNRLVRVGDELIFHREAIDGLRLMLKQYAEKNLPERTIEVAAFKDLAGVSRKYAIPLLEYFDRERVTLRRGDKRVILL